MSHMVLIGFFSRVCDRKLTFSLVDAKSLFGAPKISCKDAVDWPQSGYWPISSVLTSCHVHRMSASTPVLVLDRLSISQSVYCIVNSLTSDSFFCQILHYFWNQIFGYFVKSLSLNFFETKEFLFMKHK